MTALQAVGLLKVEPFFALLTEVTISNVLTISFYYIYLDHAVAVISRHIVFLFIGGRWNGCAKHVLISTLTSALVYLKHRTTTLSFSIFFLYGLLFNSFVGNHVSALRFHVLAFFSVNLIIFIVQLL